MNLFDLTGKRALVTGSSRGIGRAVAEGLLEAGAQVVINGVNDRLFKTAQELAASTGCTVIPVQADLSQREENKRLFAESLDKLGGLDILVVNHGIQRSHPAEAFPIEDWDTVLEVDLTSLFMLDQLGGQHMLTHGGGKIINVASLLSVIGGTTVPAYAAAKGGVAQLTKALSNEWAGRGVTVNAIVPGFIHTDLTEDLVHDPGEGARLLARIPVGRWGIPDDLKGIAVFLASAASNYVSGAIIPVDGGFLAR
ncbi:MAG: SDR family oxidoreductase [Anaerolineae bacterium]|nr:SDR family oxidoreductase [Anaerolineae bacterium]